MRANRVNWTATLIERTARRSRRVVCLGALCAIAPAASHAQQQATPETLASVAKALTPYRVTGISYFGSDSVLVEVVDSSRTNEAVEAGTWMFGPPVTLEEAGGCPPPKVLGRRVARILWRAEAKRVGVQQVAVRVRGTVGLGAFSWVEMYYGVPDLDNPWVGDRK